MRAFPETAEHVEWLDRLVGDILTCWMRYMAKQCLTRRHALAREFQCRTGDRHMGKYFPAMLPSEGRSERGAPIGVLVSRNGGRRKKLPIAGYSNNSCGLSELTTRRNPIPSILKLFYGSNIMLREKKYSDSH